MNLFTQEALSVDEVITGLRAAVESANVYNVETGFGNWAISNSRPGVLIEELVEASHGDSTHLPDELKCHVVFGELAFCEWQAIRRMRTPDDVSGLDSKQYASSAIRASGLPEVPSVAASGFDR